VITKKVINYRKSSDFDGHPVFNGHPIWAQAMGKVEKHQNVHAGSNDHFVVVVVGGGVPSLVHLDGRPQPCTQQNNHATLQQNNHATFNATLQHNNNATL
jgi:hypothetical protein